LALFGRRPPQRVDSIVMPASENLHNSGHSSSCQGMSLRFWRPRHLDLLEPIYTWFTEGFDVADLLQAKALLDKLD